MIELLIKYIEDKGYRVEVIPGVLLIRKQVGDRKYGIDWAISSYDLGPDFQDMLYDQADLRCNFIEQAIAEASA